MWAAGITPAAIATPPDAFAGIPNLQFAYRDIRGSTAAALSESLERGARHPPQGGSSYADTRWSIDWSWRTSGQGRSCRVRTADVRFSAVVTLPRLAAGVALDPALQARWSRFAAAIAAHEARHARMAWETVPQIRRTILAATCPGVRRAGRAAIARLERAQQRYDDRTRYGAAEGAAFP